MSALPGADARAIHALNMARDAGISIAVDGDDLVLTAAAPPLPAVLEALSQCKLAIIRRLHREVALDALREAMTGDSQFSDGVCAVRENIWFTRWHLRTRRGYRTLGSCMAAFQQTRDDLVGDDKIACSDGYVWTFRCGRLAD